MTRHEALPASNHIGIPVGFGAFMAEGRRPLRRMKRGPVPGLDYFAEKAVPAAGKYSRAKGTVASLAGMRKAPGGAVLSRRARRESWTGRPAPESSGRDGRALTHRSRWKPCTPPYKMEAKDDA